VFDLFAVQNGLDLLFVLAMFVAKTMAFVDAVARPPALFVAADRQTKQFWLIILGLALAANVVIWQSLSILNLAGLVAALVYLADARPAMRALNGRR